MNTTNHTTSAIDVLDELKQQYHIFTTKAETTSNEMAINIMDLKRKSAKSIGKVMSAKLKMLPPIFIIYAIFYFLHVVSLTFIIATFAMVLLDAGGDYYLNRIAARVNIDTDLCTYQLELLRTKRLRTLKLQILAPISVAWAAWFGLSLLAWMGAETPSNILIVSVGLPIVVAIGLCIEYYLYRRLQRYNDHLLALLPPAP